MSWGTSHSTRWIGAWTAITLGVGARAHGQAPPLQGLDQYITTAMKAWNVPGLALAVVKDGQIVLAKGYGVRQVGRPEPVDEHTLFAIGSASKAFTATAIGMLVDEGKLDLDAPATRYLPTFQLFDPYATREVTVRDLLTHRTGVAGGDLLWASGGFDRDEIVRRIRFIPPTWSLRSRFDYSNIMFIAAGQVLAAAAGKSWDAVVRERIFGPLEMAESNSTISDLLPNGNVATPHNPTAGAPIPVPWRRMDNTVAGGGINSSAHDMAQWLLFQLRSGEVGGRRLVSKAFLQETRTPQTIIRREGSWEMMTPDAHFMTYGIGWFLSDYHGRQMLQHGGGIDGMSAMVGVIPEAGVGVVVLSNLNGNQLPAALMHRVFDAYLGLPPADWSARFLAVTKRATEQAEAAERQMEAGRVAGTAPTLPLERYAGTYRNQAWGDATVTLEGGKLMLRYGTEFEGELEHVQYDAFRAHWRNPARGTDYLNFTIDVKRQAVELDLYLWLVANFRRVEGESDPGARP